MTGIRKLPASIIDNSSRHDGTVHGTGRLKVSALESFFGENSRPAKTVLETGLWQLAGRVSRGRRWGWDGASLKSASAFSDDPITYNGQDFNLYRYVANRPANATDESGLSAEPIISHLPNGMWRVIVDGQTFWGTTKEAALAAAGYRSLGFASGLTAKGWAYYGLKGGLYGILAGECVFLIWEIYEIETNLHQAAVNAPPGYNAPGFWPDYGHYFYQDFIGWWAWW
jgi:hypothetical protein